MSNHKSDATWHPGHGPTGPPKHHPETSGHWTPQNVGKWLAYIFVIWFFAMVLMFATVSLLKQAF